MVQIKENKFLSEFRKLLSKYNINEIRAFDFDGEDNKNTLYCVPIGTTDEVLKELSEFTMFYGLNSKKEYPYYTATGGVCKLFEDSTTEEVPVLIYKNGIWYKEE